MDNELAVVARLAQQVKDAQQVIGRLDLIDLLLAREIHQVIAGGVGRLRNERIGEGLGIDHNIRVRAIERPGFGVVDTQLLADRIETFLLRDVVEQLKIVIRNSKPLGKLFLVLGENARMPIGAAKDDGDLASRREFGTELTQEIHDRIVSLSHGGNNAIIN